MKHTPMSSGRSSGWVSCAWRRASMAAISMGGSIFITFSRRDGNRSEMSRTTTGHAELMTGRLMPSVFRYSRVYADTSSAA